MWVAAEEAGFAAEEVTAVTRESHALASRAFPGREESSLPLTACGRRSDEDGSKAGVMKLGVSSPQGRPKKQRPRSSSPVTVTVTVGEVPSSHRKNRRLCTAGLSHLPEATQVAAAAEVWTLSDGKARSVNREAVPRGNASSRASNAVGGDRSPLFPGAFPPGLEDPTPLRSP